jgi:hypothetical protein
MNKNGIQEKKKRTQIVNEIVFLKQYICLRKIYLKLGL